MKKFKIFYSWQSDLPGSKTRNFIRECIDEAIELAEESEAIEAERDEATTGTTGSPDIVSTLFSKIDDCDLFIADLSLCFSENLRSKKKSSNPNVLLELGYAVKTLGWERIICLCNTDYGDEYPFDIAHNRITNFSLEEKNKREVKGKIAKIIFINIRDIRKLSPRAKSGMAMHVIGTYDFSSKNVVGMLIPVEISRQESYILHNEELLRESKNLFDEIRRLTSQIRATDNENNTLQVELPRQEEASAEIQSSLSEVIHMMAESYKDSETSVIWDEIDDDRKRIKRWLGCDVPDDFFDMGGLKERRQLFNLNNSIFIGTDDEKEKNDKLHMLSYKLQLLDIRENYLKTFDEMYFIPLAIQNVSSMQDTDIDILINVEIGEIINPDEHLIWEEYEGLQGLLCRDDEDETDVGIICELFSLNEDGIIHAENIPYDPTKYIPKTPIITLNGLSQPDKTEKEYKQELEDFIESTCGREYYEFNIESLRPGECKWLCRGMLIKPVDCRVKVSYRLYSQNTSGELSGVLEMKIN